GGILRRTFAVEHGGIQIREVIRRLADNFLTIP
ncbi:MAG: hypothetical protein ACI8V5_003351, partial [Limisphaerales bacterium]